MTGSDPRLERLRALANLLAERALVPVAAKRAQRDAVQSRIDAMSAHRRHLMQSAGDPLLAATMLAQAERVRQAQARESMSLARAEVDLIKAQQAAARAVGRKQALEALQKRNSKILRQKAARKQERS